MNNNGWKPIGKPVNINEHDKETYSWLKLAGCLVGIGSTLLVWSVPILAIILGWHWLECRRFIGGC